MQNSLDNCIEIYTDGAFSPLRCQGGWAFVILKNGEKIYSNFGGEVDTTNNRMEIQSVIEALSWIIEDGSYKSSPLIIYSDSLYVINSMIGKYSRKKNLSLWDKLDSLVKELDIEYIHVKGHSGNKLNTFCDVLAVEGSKIKI